MYQHLGHSLRTPGEALLQARNDAQVGTSLLESRLLFGSAEVYGRFSEMMKSHNERRGPALARSFIAERRKERLEFGETVYLLEPNVKRSRGGLRDIHLLRWLWNLKTGVADPDRLHDLGHLSKFDYRRLLSAQKFLAPRAQRDALSRQRDVRCVEPRRAAAAGGGIQVPGP